MGGDGGAHWAGLLKLFGAQIRPRDPRLRNSVEYFMFLLLNFSLKFALILP